MISGYRLERRRYKRLRLTLSVMYWIESPAYVKRILQSRIYEGRTVDLSEGGVALAVNHYLPLRTKLCLRFVLIEASSTGDAHFYNTLEIAGEVRSTVTSVHHEYRLGVCFEGLSFEKRRRINDILFSSLRPESVGIG
ncbi:MAG: PilZ domain-containing protein [Candidatus Omnitrophota bacterium]